MTLDFGALDWKRPIEMMLRELISNALDAVDGNWDNVTIEYVDKPRARAGHTQVFVQLTNDVREYVTSLGERFLHVSGSQNKTCLRNNEPGPCRFYRKGVFVHEVTCAAAMYSYNCGDSLPIDESRNLDNYRVAGHAADLLSRDPVACREVLAALGRGEKIYEGGFSSWYLDGPSVARAARVLWGDDVSVTDSQVTWARGLAKGLNCVLLPASWHGAIVCNDVPDTVSLLSRADAEGLTCYPASEELEDTCCRVWDALETLGLTGNLAMPPVMEFERPIESGAFLGGFYCRLDGTIYIHREHVRTFKVVLEELAHYVTGAGDETRDFQDWAFRVAGLLIERL